MCLLTLLLLTPFSFGQEDQDTLFRVIRDAAVTNANAFPRGRMSFRLEVETTERGKVERAECEGTVVWNDQDALYVLKAHDPDKLVVAGAPYDAPIDQARADYVLILGNRLYVYNAYTTTLHLHERQSASESDYNRPYLSVLPAHWHWCCPPWPLEGLPWTEMSGPEARTVKNGATMSVARLENGLIRQTRIDPGSGKAETDFDPNYCFNVVRSTYMAEKPSLRSQQLTQTWRVPADGRCAPQERRMILSKKGKPSEKSYEYRLVVTNFEPDADVGPSRLGFEALKGFLPPDTRLIDHITGRESRLFGGAAPALPPHREFTDMIRARGFLKR